MTYADYNSEDLYGATSQESEGFDATSEEAGGGDQNVLDGVVAREEEETKEEEGQLGSDENEEEEEENLDEWGEPLNKYASDPVKPRVIRQTGHVDLFGTLSSPKKKTKKALHKH